MRALLDANVLFPTVLREILCDLAGADLFAPLWSARILDEWRHAAARLGPAQDAIAGAEIALMRSRFPGAEVAHDGTRAIDLDLPDPADRHVIEAALAGRAEAIVSANLRDFPLRAMAGLGLRILHPDAFVVDIFQRHPGPVRAAVARAQARAAAAGGGMTATAMLKRSRLPRLARAMAAEANCR